MANLPLRPQQYRLTWPINAVQLEHIDTMFETLFRQLRQVQATAQLALTTAEDSTIGGTSIAFASGDGSAGDDESLSLSIPGPQGATGATGPIGPPGLPGEDGDDNVMSIPPSAGAAHALAATLLLAPSIYADRVANPSEGTIAAFSDSNTAVQSATVAGGGAHHILAFFDGTNWLVVAGV